MDANRPTLGFDERELVREARRVRRGRAELWLPRRGVHAAARREGHNRHQLPRAICVDRPIDADAAPDRECIEDAAGGGAVDPNRFVPVSNDSHAHPVRTQQAGRLRLTKALHPERKHPTASSPLHEGARPRVGRGATLR